MNLFTMTWAVKEFKQPRRFSNLTGAPLAFSEERCSMDGAPLAFHKDRTSLGDGAPLAETVVASAMAVAMMENFMVSSRKRRSTNECVKVKWKRLDGKSWRSECDCFARREPSRCKPLDGATIITSAAAHKRR